MTWFKVTVRMYTLAGPEIRHIEVNAKNEASACSKVARAMGNRAFDITFVVKK